nr:MAG TPA: hypothetical protein [Caudoviricetes sp.]
MIYKNNGLHKRTQKVFSNCYLIITYKFGAIH